MMRKCYPIVVAIIALILAVLACCPPTGPTTPVVRTRTLTQPEVTATPPPIPTPWTNLTATSEAGATPTVTPEPTEAPEPTEVPEPTEAPEPTATPGPLTYADIEQARKELTDLQWETYSQNIVGERIQFAGEVMEVYDDGRVLIDEGRGLFTTCVLYEVSLDIAVTLSKGQFVQGEGTIREVDTFLGLAVRINVDSLQ